LHSIPQPEISNEIRNPSIDDLFGIHLYGPILSTPPHIIILALLEINMAVTI
jgi:hypothetical protein